METDIIEKQYTFLDKHFTTQKSIDLLSSKNEESVKIMELVMRTVNEDKRGIFKLVD